MGEGKTVWMDVRMMEGNRREETRQCRGGWERRAKLYGGERSRLNGAIYSDYPHPIKT